MVPVILKNFSQSAKSPSDCKNEGAEALCPLVSDQLP